MPKTKTTRATDKTSTKSSTQSSQKTKKIIKRKAAPTKAAKSASKPTSTKKWPAQSPVAKKKPMVGAGTKHIGTPKFSNEFAEICLCPGDPLRAKFIADNFLTNCKLIQ